MFFDVVLLRLLGLFNDVVGLEVPFQSVTDVGAEEFKGVCQGYG